MELNILVEKSSQASGKQKYQVHPNESNSDLKQGKIASSPPLSFSISVCQVRDGSSFCEGIRGVSKHPACPRHTLARGSGISRNFLA